MSGQGDDGAEALYRRAHDLHYKGGDLLEAARLYQRVSAFFPDAPEASYARTQLDNLAKHIELPVPPSPPAIEQRLADQFRCPCGSVECSVTAASLGDDSPYRGDRGHRYLAITCQQCARVELLNRSVLERLGGLERGR